MSTDETKKGTAQGHTHALTHAHAHAHEQSHEQIRRILSLHRDQVRHKIAAFLNASCVRSVSESHNPHQETGSDETLFDVIEVSTPVEEIIFVAQNNLHVPDEVVFLAIVYLQRYLHRAHKVLTTRSLPSLFLTALLLASKFLLDTPYNNLTYSYLAQCSVVDMNHLEVEFLRSISFHLMATDANILRIMELFAADVASPEDIREHPRFRSGPSHPTSNDHPASAAGSADIYKTL